MKRVIALILVCAMVLAACGTHAGNASSSDTAAAAESVTEAAAESSADTAGQEAVSEEATASVEETAAEAETVSEAEATTEEAEGDTEEVTAEEPETVTEEAALEDELPEFTGLSDPELLQYMADSINVDLNGEFQSDDYFVESVITIYYSKEYLEEVAYNSEANIFFGYTLAELDEQFQGERYIFTLGENGETVVQKFEDYDDTYDRVIKNVAIGSGVILICVTVSVATAGVGTAPVSLIFAASAKTATTMALSSGAISGVAAGIVKGVETGDFEEAVKAGALTGSESFKWGAIEGAVIGGINEAVYLKRIESNYLDYLDDPNYSNEEIKIYGSADGRAAEERALEIYPGREQVSYLNGQEVKYATPGSTRPDIVRTVGDHLEAIEVKCYDLSTSYNRTELYKKLVDEISDRVINLPTGSTQRVVLDVTGKNYSTEILEKVTQEITSKLANIYPNIPIDFIGL